MYYSLITSLQRQAVELINVIRQSCWLHDLIYMSQLDKLARQVFYRLMSAVKYSAACIHARIRSTIMYLDWLIGDISCITQLSHVAAVPLPTYCWWFPMMN